MLYSSRRAWEEEEPELESFAVHAGVHCPNPSLKTTYSLMDDGRRVYMTHLASCASGIVQRKFGANSMQEIRAFACALRSLIQAPAAAAEGGGSRARGDRGLATGGADERGSSAWAHRGSDRA